MSVGAVLIFLTLILTSARVASAQEWGAVEGKVTDSETRFPIPGATVIVYGTNFGTAAGADGAFVLRLPPGRVVLRVQSVGFTAQMDTIEVMSGAVVRHSVALDPVAVEMEGVTIEGQGVAQAGVFEISPETLADIPAPMRDALRALRIYPGVASSNELSNQFSVRGGGYNENLFFINGFEIYLPFRPRTGEQEGLSLINPDLAQKMTLYTGGFPVNYGGKLSAAVDAQYRRPQRTGGAVSGTGYVSLLDAGLSAGGAAADGRLGWLIAGRKARARRFFQTQDLKGEYQPDYGDLQGYLGYRIAQGHELEALGMLARNEFRLDPNSRKTFFGTLSQNESQAPSNLQSLWVSYDAGNEEVDQYTTRFLGFRMSNRLSPTLRAEHDVSIFDTEETEKLDLSGTAILFQVDPGSGDPQGGDGLFPTGSSRQEDFADNRVAVQTLAGQGRWFAATRRHAVEAGWQVRRLEFEDRLSEKSVVVGKATTGDVVRLVADSLNDAASLGAWQAGFYTQDGIDVFSTDPGKLYVTGGLRADYYSFTGEWTLSPRASFSWRQNPITTYFGSIGLYHQAPTYRELRGKPEVGETILGALNRDLASQRALQVVLGGEYFLPSRRFHVRAEAYFKDIRDLISYDVENVRVRYSGQNDATGRTYGLDLQLRGELVPGMESWINYGFLVAREQFKPAFETERNEGSIARPTDQRHTVSIFIRDYFTSDPTWRLHMRTLFGSGLPYTPPVPGPRVGSVVTQVPGDRFSARYQRFFRFDIGASKEITREEIGFPFSVELTAEILNLFDMTNTVSYSWYPDAVGIWQRVPTRLTPRTLNVRATVRF